MDDEPITRYTLLVLHQAQQDHATEVVIAPRIGIQPPIRYKVEGVWYDMAPPPAEILLKVIAELGRLAAFTAGPFPKEGLIDVPFSGTRLRWLVRMTSPEVECLLTPADQ